MWRALFIGWIAIALAEDTSDDSGVSKRQTGRENTVVYGAAPGQYLIQNPYRTATQQSQADYQSPSEQLYVISPNRKPVASALTYSSESPRRPQYVQLSALQHLQAQQAAGQQSAHHVTAQQAAQQQAAQQQAAQQAAAQQAAAQHVAAQQTIHQVTSQQVAQPIQPQLTYEGLLSQTEAGHGAFYRPSSRLQLQPQTQPQQYQARLIHQRPLQPQPVQPQHEPANPIQYAASSIVDSNAGSFERELAQLVAANRAQEQKYNAVNSASTVRQSALVKRPPAPAHQQYLKEITRPVVRPRPQPQPQSQPLHYHPAAAVPQAAPLYRLIYQPEQLQQIPQISSQQKQHEEPQTQYVRPQLQQYLQLQAQAQPQVQETRASPEDTASPSRSAIYVSRSTPLKKQAYSVQPAIPDREEEEQKPVPVVRIPAQRNRPLTQQEFQQILQSGGYTAQLVPSDNPNLPHQEYLLHPTGAQTQSQRALYANEKQEPVTYVLPQQRPIKRRPVYGSQSQSA